MMVAKVMHAVGSDFLRDEIVPKVVRGEVTIARGMSEPEAVSDVAAIQRRARTVHGGWVLYSKKMVTTHGPLADYVSLMRANDPEQSTRERSEGERERKNKE